MKGAVPVLFHDQMSAHICGHIWHSGVTYRRKALSQLSLLNDPFRTPAKKNLKKYARFSRGIDCHRIKGEKSAARMWHSALPGKTFEEIRTREISKTHSFGNGGLIMLFFCWSLLIWVATLFFVEVCILDKDARHCNGENKIEGTFRGIFIAGNTQKQISTLAINSIFPPFRLRFYDILLF